MPNLRQTAKQRELFQERIKLFLEREVKQMKINKKSLFLFFMTLLLVFSVGCSNNDTVEEDFYIEDRATESVVYLKDQFDQLLALSDQFLQKSENRVLTAEEVYQKIVIDESPEYLVVDIRSAADYSKGAIKTAVNLPMEFTTNPYQLTGLPKDKTLIVVCYSGHSAGHTVSLLNMLGYDAVAMLNGMAGWTTADVAGSKLPTATFNFPLTTETSDSQSLFSLPDFTDEEVATINDLVLVKSKQIIESGKGLVVRPADLEADIGNEDKYFVVDIRTAADYNKGHIQGAIHIPYGELAQRTNLERMPADKPIVLAGYTGTDAAQAARVLNQLNYDAYSLLYGMRLWSDNSVQTGIQAISAEVITDLPTIELKYDIDAAPADSAGCS